MYKIGIFTTTRAEFGILYPVISYLDKSNYFDVSVEGLCSLARLVQTKANCILIRSVPSIISFLCLFLDNDNTEIIYPTLIILKFLLNQHKNLVSQFSLKKGLGQNLGKTYKNLIQDVKKNMM